MQEWDSCVYLPPTGVSAGPLEQSSRPRPAQGQGFPVWSKREAYSWRNVAAEKMLQPCGWVRQAVWQCGSAGLWGMKSPQWSHPTHVKATDKLCMCTTLPFGFTPSAGLHGMLPLSSEILPLVPPKFPLHQPELDSFLGRVHVRFHTAAGMSGDLLVIPAHSLGKVCVHQGCTSCGYFPFEAREVKLFAWYIPFISSW